MKELHGNLAAKAWLATFEEDGAWKGRAVCFSDAEDFALFAEKEELPQGCIFVVQEKEEKGGQKQAEEQEKLQSAVNRLSFRFPKGHFLVIAAQKAEAAQGVSVVYIEDPSCGRTSPLNLVCSRDTIEVQKEEGKLYLYVADLELLFRQEEMMVFRQRTRKK